MTRPAAARGGWGWVEVMMTQDLQTTCLTDPEWAAGEIERLRAVANRYADASSVASCERDILAKNYEAAEREVAQLRAKVARLLRDAGVEVAEDD